MAAGEASETGAGSDSARDVRNIRLVVQYDGTGLSGWQRQADAPSVQGFLENAVARIVGHPVICIGSGRTDAGVHARGQVVNFKTTSSRLPREILRGGNALLPEQIAIILADDVPLSFHARYSARSKIYDYDLDVSPVRPVIDRHYVWHQPWVLDVDRMTEALTFIRGTHDFAAFQSTGTPVSSTVRTMMAAELTRPVSNLIRISLEADGFLRHMVRAIVGTLVLAGRHKITAETFGEIVKRGERAKAGPTAPARGLCLREVKY